MEESEALVIKNGEVIYMRDAYIAPTITVPDSVTVIGEQAFRVHGNLRVVTLPSSVTHIKARAFEGCFSLEMVYIPKSVTTIDDDAFRSCERLTIYCEGEPVYGWINRRAKRQFEERYVTDEDDAFNFHRSAGGFTCHTYKYNKIVFCSYNPDNAPVVTNVTREQFEKLAKERLATPLVY